MTRVIEDENQQLRKAIGEQTEKADRIRNQLHNYRRKANRWRIGWIAMHDPDNQELLVADLVSRLARHVEQES